MQPGPVGPDPDPADRIFENGRHLAASEGRGVVLVVHDLNLAMNHADRVLVLGCDEPANSVVADGPPEEALSPDNIQRCWGVDARWIGQEGERALIVG